MKFSKYYKNCKNLLKPKNLFGTLIVLAVIYLLFTNFNGLFEGFGEQPKEILLLHMNGCGHCKKMMPEWDEFVRNNNNTGLTTRAVEVDEDPSLSKKYQVSGFPTILLLGENGNKIETYEGERTAAGLTEYAKKKGNKN